MGALSFPVAAARCSTNGRPYSLPADIDVRQAVRQMKEWTGRSNLRTVRQNGAMAFSNALLLETSELQTPPEVRLNGAGANGQFSLLQLFGPRYFRRRVRRNRATSTQGRAEGRHSWMAEICVYYFLG